MINNYIIKNSKIWFFIYLFIFNIKKNIYLKKMKKSIEVLKKLIKMIKINRY